jgi:sporulation protein YlmC with PRC-barrel domain
MQQKDRASRRVLVGVAALGAAAFASGLLAQQPREPAARDLPDYGFEQLERRLMGPQAPGPFRQPLFRVDGMLGHDVRGAQGEDLGWIEDVVLDAQAGAARYLVIGRGGFLGIGAEYHAVPWAAAQLQLGDHTARDPLHAAIDERTLLASPPIDPQRLATDPATFQQIDRHYAAAAGAPPPHAPAAAPDYFRALDLDGDGTITREEVQTAMALARRLERAFDRVDQAGDGVIHPEEFAAFEERGI